MGLILVNLLFKVPVQPAGLRVTGLKEQIWCQVLTRLFFPNTLLLLWLTSSFTRSLSLARSLTFSLQTPQPAYPAPRLWDMSLILSSSAFSLSLAVVTFTLRMCTSIEFHSWMTIERNIALALEHLRNPRKPTNIKKILLSYSELWPPPSVIVIVSLTNQSFPECVGVTVFPPP